jgi:hypothetical protein
LNSVKSAAAICIGNLTEVMYVEWAFQHVSLVPILYSQ